MDKIFDRLLEKNPEIKDEYLSWLTDRKILKGRRSDFIRSDEIEKCFRYASLTEEGQTFDFTVFYRNSNYEKDTGLVQHALMESENVYNWLQDVLKMDSKWKYKFFQNHFNESVYDETMQKTLVVFYDMHVVVIRFSATVNKSSVTVVLQTDKGAFYGMENKKRYDGKRPRSEQDWISSVLENTGDSWEMHSRESTKKQQVQTSRIKDLFYAYSKDHSDHSLHNRDAKKVRVGQKVCLFCMLCSKEIEG